VQTDTDRDKDHQDNKFVDISKNQDKNKDIIDLLLSNKIATEYHIDSLNDYTLISLQEMKQIISIRN